MTTYPTESTGAPIGLSIIVPVRNSAATLGRCLQAITTQITAIDELLVIDDHSTDDSAAIASQFAAQLITPDNERGRIAARRIGCAHAKHEVLVCIDSDVLIPANALSTIRTHFYTHPRTAAAYMRLDANAPCLSLCGRYKNIYMHTMLSKLGAHDPVLYGATHVLRASSFVQVNTRYEGVEDNALGLALAKKNLQVDFLSEIQVQHLKEYSFATLLKNDFRVARKWAYLFHAHFPKRTTFQKGFLHASPKLLAAILVLPLAVISLWISVTLALLLLLLWFALNHSLLLALWLRLSLVEFLLSIALLISTQTAYVLGVAKGTLDYYRTAKHKRERKFSLFARK